MGEGVWRREGVGWGLKGGGVRVSLPASFASTCARNGGVYFVKNERVILICFLNTKRIFLKVNERVNQKRIISCKTDILFSFTNVHNVFERKGQIFITVTIIL